MLLHHPWVTASPSSSTTTKHVRKSNSTILNHYLQKTTEKDDTIALGNNSPSPSPYYTSPINAQQHPLSTNHLKQSSPPHCDLPTLQSKSSFANKLNKRNPAAVGLTARQSMPAIVVNKQHDIPLTPHVHNLIDCSFPKGNVY